ncbi:MAG: polysaccharide deacetylase family protein [Bacillota bacterium]
MVSHRFASLVLSIAILLAQPGPKQTTINQPYPPPPPPPVVVEKPEIAVGQVLKLPKRGETRVITTGRVGSSQVALTFDAGWEFEQTRALLKVLRENKVKATFFLRGGWMRTNPELVKEIAADGHEIGNHSWTHSHMPELGNSVAWVEIQQTREELSGLSKQARLYYRPPYGEYSDRDLGLAGELGYRWTVMWSIDSLDWTMPGEAAIAERLRRLGDGGIALMHLGVWQTVNALPGVIAELRERHLEPVPLSAILDWSTFPTEDYTVKDGDTVNSIAAAFEIEPQLVRELNKLETKSPQPAAHSPQ